MNLLLLASLTIFLGFNIFIVLKYGVPPSLSDSYYLMGKHGYVFPIIMTLISVTLLPFWLEISVGSTFQFLGFLAPASLLFVGAAPNFRDTFQKNIHFTSAFLSAIVSILWIVLVAKMWSSLIIVAFLVVALMLITESANKRIYWLEMLAFGSTYYTMILLII